MSAPDVLAVLDDARNVLTSLGSPGTANGVAEARAAVAELVEAGKFLASNPLGMVTPGALNRWNAALARVQGGAA